MDAEDLMLREFLGIRTREETEAAARWIVSKQRDDGTWANFYGGPGDLSTTVEAYVALRLAGHLPHATHMARAAAWIRDQGGIPATRVFTRIWLALFGEWSWDDLPVMPPELIYFPAWFPLNVYDFACWARQTIVPLTIVGTMRPAKQLPFGIKELLPDENGSKAAGRERGGRAAAEPSPGVGRGLRKPADAWTVLFESLDRALHTYERRAHRAKPVRAVRQAALRRCAEWIIARQEQDGCWGGIQPPWVYSLIALHLLGYSLDHPVMRRGLAGLDRFTIIEDTPEGPVRRLEACQSPVWDTMLAMIALADAGLPADHPALVQAADWMLAEEVAGPGDWQVRRPGLSPGGWAFEFDNDVYPDNDDTAEAVIALRRAQSSHGDAAREAAIERGLTWLAGMASADGGWGAFDADNTSRLVTKLPFCDFGAVTDPPSADVTAHAVEALAQAGLAGTRAARRGVVWLLRAQEQDGSWFGRWGANYIYGTGAVVPALIAAGVRPGKPAIRRAVEWLEAHQNPDGGWGEDMRSYDDPSLAGRGASTASQTAWALLALLAAAGEGPPGPSAEAGIRWLAERQRPDGTWDEPEYTGTGFPRDFYLNYHLYRLVFPVSALGRYLSPPAALPPPGTP
jgi:squalene-hopene/tetraprenyl-beta-curcumene cyclase